MPGETKAAEWEEVIQSVEGESLERIRIPGGWLYRTIVTDDPHSIAVALAFVNTEDVDWDESTQKLKREREERYARPKRGARAAKPES